MVQFELIFIIPLIHVFISTLYFSYNFGNSPLIYCKLSLIKVVCSNKNIQNT